MEAVFHRELIEEVPEWGTQALLQMQQKVIIYLHKKKRLVSQRGEENKSFTYRNESNADGQINQ